MCLRWGWEGYVVVLIRAEAVSVDHFRHEMQRAWARKVQSSSRRKQRHRAYVCVCLCVCVGVCMCVTIIRATALSNSRGTICCVFYGLLGGTIHATCSAKDTPWICATQRPWEGW